MCGISGLLTFDNTSERPEFSAAVRKMTSLLARRGPDDEGFWNDPQGHIYLGFRRLAILDTSLAGHQPMISSDGRSIIVFNGEIYNFLELRQELEQAGVRFRSRSDTEVLLEALNNWGVDAISRLNGMFALAWYDTIERRLVLARDHAGIKPLYYFVDSAGRGVAFSSQFNALLHTPWGTPGAARLDVLKLYLRLHHIPPPYGLLENTYQLEPGHILIAKHNGSLEKRAWWKLPRDPKPSLSADAALEALAEAIQGAVRRQRLADVPLGVFLSGGVDSPLVTAVARSQTGSSLKAFTLGNPGWGQDESAAATSYASHLDVNHCLHSVTGQEALAAIDDVIAAQHEPFGDFSILPTLLVSRLARSQVTVSLSGDGGDELFFGYERPVSLMRNGTDFRWPMSVRLALYAAGKYHLGPRRSEAIVSRTPGHYYFEVNSRLADRDLRKLAPQLDSLPSDFSLYAFEGYRDLRGLANYSRWVEFYGQLQRCLKKVDMASMHHSLEVRVPLLDRKVIDVSLQTDPFHCSRNGTRKLPLRNLLAKHVPAEIIPKAKRGFAVPLGDWLRGPLRDLVEDTLFGNSLYPEAIFDRPSLRQYWQSHLSGQRDLKWGIWTLLSLQWWAQKHLKTAVGTHPRTE